MMLFAVLVVASLAQERFEAGDPAAALQLLQETPELTNPVWRYNRALSAHAVGQMGTAMADYEWLNLRDPQDDAVRINRLLARLDRGAGDDAEPPMGYLVRLPLRSLMLVGLLAVGLALWRRRRDALTRGARGLAMLCLVLFAGQHLLLALDSRNVAVAECSLRERPEASARRVIDLPAGNLLHVVAAQGDWIEVRTGSGVRGWLKRSDLVALDGVGE